MTTLTTTPLAPLLDRLFAEAEEASAKTEAAVADLSDEELKRWWCAQCRGNGAAPVGRLRLRLDVR